MHVLTDLQERVLAVVIERRRKNPIRGVEVANAVEMKDRDSGKEGADLRAVVNALRSKGYPICASGEGYYWPASKTELQEYIDSLAGRIDQQIRAMEGMKNGFDKVEIEVDTVLAELPRPTVHVI